MVYSGFCLLFMQYFLKKKIGLNGLKDGFYFYFWVKWIDSNINYGIVKCNGFQV